MTILVVDDRKETRNQLLLLLENNGYQAIGAVNGVEALALGRENRPDLVITDILLPELDGFTLCHEWQQDSRLREIPLIFYTATYTDEPDREYALSLGAVRYIIKSDEPEELILGIHEVLHQAHKPVLQPGDQQMFEQSGLLKQYNESLVHRLKQKTQQLEETKRKLVRDITEKNLSDDALRTSEEKYRIIAENTADVIVILDLMLKSTYVSPSVERITGFTVEEYLDLPFDHTMTDDSKKLVRQLFTEELEKEASGTAELHRSRVIETEEHRKDGSVIWFEGRFSFLRDSESRPIGILGISRDITKRKRIEEELNWNYNTQSTINSILAISVEEIPLTECLERSLQILLTVPWLAAEGKGCIFLSNGEPNILTMATEVGLSERIKKSCGRVQFGKCLCGKAALTGRTIFASGLDNDHDVLYGDAKPHGHYCVPIELEGVILGVINLYTHEGHVRNPLEAAFLTAIANVLAGVINRRNAEARLRESEAQLTNAVKIARLGPWNYDVESNLFTFNDAFYDIFRTTAEREGGYTMSPDQYARRFVHPEDAESVGRETRKAIETDDPNFTRQVEHRINYADGEMGYITVRFYVIKNAAGKTIKTYGVNQDITDRKEAEKKVTASEVRYRRLFEAAKDGILILDAETGMILDVNPFLTQMLGYTHEQFLEKTVWEIGFLKDIVSNLQNFLELQTKEYVRYEDMPLETSDGRKINVEFVSNVYLVNDKKVVQCNIRDITERKKAEEARLLSEARLKHIIESSNDIIYVFQDYKFQLVNAKFEELTGWTREEAMADEFDIFSVYTPESRMEALERLEKRERGEPVPDRYTFKFKSKKGKIHELEAIVSTVIWNGKPATMGFCRDVTEQKSLEYQIQQAVKMETVGRLAGGIAHDFNNLLTVISGHSDMALSQLSIQDPLYHDVIAIQAASDRAAGLTRQLLAFSRKQVLEPKIINLSSLVDNLQKMLRRLIGEDVNLTIKANPDQWNIKADPGQIEQVIVNLSTNARDAMPDGGNLVIESDNVTLDDEYCKRTSGFLAGDYVQLTVSDDGGGMSEQIISKIFEPFFTTKETGKGTGLGLSTVFGIVKQSGGQINVYSEVGIGSTFKIYFPRVHEASSEAEPYPNTLSADLKGSETILVVEDEATVRQVTERALQQQGYKVITAQSGGDALLLVESIDHVVDLVLTDVIMPGITGVEFVTRLRQRWPNVKALFMSGYTAEAIARHGVLEAGMQFIGKPFKLNDLLKKVREVIHTNTGNN